MKSPRFRGIYLGLLLASTLVRLWLASSPHPLPDQNIAWLPEVGGAPGKVVGMVYRDFPSSGRTDAPVLVLLHGSPVASVSLNRLVDELRGRFRLIVPDLPGMGRSQWNVADYSVEAHAVYVRELLDELGVKRVHVAGYSMGGGVAIALAGQSPERVSSLTLISGLGVQEHELLGDYALNHAIHGLQLWALRAVDDLVPHFGLLDWFPLNTSYARNFYDTDQRPLRGWLAGWNGPALIVQGKGDDLVPPAAAREHARLMPQSEVEWIEGGHGLIFGEKSSVVIADRLAAFVNEVEAGRAHTRAQAAPERLAASLPAADPHAGEPWSDGRAITMLVLLALATLVSEDFACIGGGLLVAAGKLTFWPVTLACFAGIFIGDLLLVAAGWWGGRKALASWPLRSWVSPAAVERAEGWFEKKGAYLILVSRFVPGTRLPTYVSAGILRVPLMKFVPWFVLACILWTPLLVGTAMLAGNAALGWLAKWSEASVALLVAGVVAWGLAKLGLKLATWRGRRLWVSRWRRLSRWEFWPMWVVYPPVVLYGIWQGIRHRSFTVFTAANPGIGAGGGLVGESKSEILAGLAGAGDVIAAWILVAPGDANERADRVKQFAAVHGYPVVLKPDVGERGTGVVIARGEPDVVKALADESGALIAQAYVPGAEYGVFYFRHPGAAKGEILAITDKRLPAVIGDGKSPLEQLILTDDRAVCMADFFLKKFTARLDEVLAAGERVVLAELGTHCRGALFLDGTHLLTPELHAEVERVSRTFDGFYFGRYDVRAASEAAFVRGEFKVIELNGLTSEATSIYDPRHSVWFGWRMLFKQWRLAFEIGAANRKQGARVLAVHEIWELIGGES
jgi:pimeloyl-ACP methyl ester carboxylesterase/membrane protein DedA with SNARE-associated domain